MRIFFYKIIIFSFLHLNLNGYSQIHQEYSNIINLDKFEAGKNVRKIIAPKILMNYNLKKPLYIIAHGFENIKEILAPDISKQHLITVPEFMQYFQFEINDLKMNNLIDSVVLIICHAGSNQIMEEFMRINPNIPFFAYTNTLYGMNVNIGKEQLFKLSEDTAANAYWKSGVYIYRPPLENMDWEDACLSIETMDWDDACLSIETMDWEEVHFAQAIQMDWEEWNDPKSLGQIISIELLALKERVKALLYSISSS
ncbi:hypothetical protein [Fluviispira vulneris]|uniref:hypothetical protein n=1 Tax=Fluviispira vulneris TaxID=2763012 RepID=UPI0016451F59|nr:hypothetical protein [Fluviispira vulneris]